MVSLLRVTGKNVFADNVATPRLLFRPADPIPNTAQLDLSTDTVRPGFVWFLNEPTAESSLSNVEARLDELARQQDASTNASMPRILFGATANGQPWAIIRATKTGKAGSAAPADALRLCVQFNEPTSYWIQIAPSVLSVENDTITFATSGVMPHSFGKVDTSDSPFESIDAPSIAIALKGSAVGTIATTAFVQPDKIDPLGLEVRFSQVGAPNDLPAGPSRDVIQRRSLPLLAGSADGVKPIKLQLVLDPLDPLNRSRTFIEPLHADGDSFLSGYVSSAGHSLLLKRKTTTQTAATGGGPSGPAFSLTRHAGEIDGDGNVTRFDDILSLEGEFELHVPGDPPVDQLHFGLMPGTAASEVVPFASNPVAPDKVTMTFGLGPAFDKRLPTGGAQAEAAAEPEDQEAFHFQDGGQGHHVTSWVRISNLSASGPGVTPPTRVISEAAAHRRLGGQKDAPQFHDPIFMTTGAAVKAASGTAGVQTAANLPAGLLPVLPIRGHLPSGNADELWAFQRNVLAVERAKLLTTSATQTGALQQIVAAAAEAPVYKRTPLGFEIEQQGENGPITAIRFARSMGDAQFGLRGDPEGSPLFPGVVDALVRNRLFLVMNRVPTFPTTGSAAIEGKIGIAGWSFDVDLFHPGHPPANPKTLVIVKGFEGRSIVDLAGDTNLWSSPDAFLTGENDHDPLGVRIARAKKILDEFLNSAVAAAGKQHAGGDDGVDSLIYNDIAQLVKDPKWSGALAINVPLGVSDLPAQLKGLMGGVNLDALKADYVTVETTPLGPDPAVRPVARLGALVNYADESPATETARQPFGFKVRRLQALFTNGEVRVFNAKLRVYVGSLFEGAGTIYRGARGSDPTTLAEPSNNIDLNGRYERRREGSATTEIYTFETADAWAYRRDLDPKDKDAFIKKVLVDRLAFVTDGSTDLGDGRVQVESRFVIDGSTSFGKIGAGEIADILDVDSVGFTDLDIAFKFFLPKLPTPNWDLSRLGLDFKFSPPNIQFDFDRYQRRKSDGGLRGFLSSFPLKLSGFDWFPNGGELGKLGFMNFAGFGASPFKFALEFDLDLGSLGALASKLKAFKMKFLFGFKENPGARSDWAFGFKFENSGGEGLEIGVEGVLKLISRQYGIISQKYQIPGLSNDKQPEVKLLYSLGTQLQILGHDLPPGDNGVTLLLFVDPSAFSKPESRASAIGWFAALAPSGGGSIAGDAIKLKLLALGQRVDPVRGSTPRSTQEVVNAITNLAPDLGGGDHGKPDEAIKNVVSLLKKGTIGFDPNAGWSVGFRANFFEVVAIDFAMRDPTLYGIRLAVTPGGGPELFSVDVLYRRLTDKLGVFSTEIVPPPTWRQIEFGWGSLTLPAIAFEIYTDGGFTVDLGYPRNNDYSRSFGFQFLPFIGSGGVYFRYVSGPAARLIPSAIRYDVVASGAGVWDTDGGVLEYKPAVEAGVAFRVGLGKEIVKGPLRVGLSITVFATLEGGYGTLYLPNGLQDENHNAITTRAAHTFIRVRGTVGILGELYGYVDFGIVKAGVTVRVWVAIGLDLRTDFRTKLFIQAGVSVSVEVVIAEFSVFGHHVRISVHFSFSTTIEYATYVGSDGPTEYYRFSEAQVAALALADAAIPPLLMVPTSVDWTSQVAPADWRASGAADLVNLTLYLAPDFTLAKSAGGEVTPEAVLLLFCPQVDTAGQQSLLGDLAAALATWALKSVLGRDQRVTGHRLRDWTLDDETIDRVAAFVAGDGVTDNPSLRRRRLPDAAAVTAFLAANLSATIIAPPPVGNVSGVLFPMPPNITIGRTGFSVDGAFDSVDVSMKTFVNDAYRDRVDQQFADLILLEKSRSSHVQAQLVDAPGSLVSTLLEEHIGLVIRAAVSKLASIARDTQLTKVGDLLDKLAAPSTLPQTSPGFDIFGTATRLFLHGPRLPMPAADLAIPPTLPRDTPDGMHGLYRMAWLQVPLRGLAGAASLTVTATAPWLNAAAAIPPVPIDNQSLADSIAAYQAMHGAGLGGEVRTDEIYRKVDKEYAARPPLPLGDNSIVRFPPELVRALAYNQEEPRAPKLATRRAAKSPDDIKAAPDDIAGAVPVIAAEIIVQRVADPSAPASADGRPSFLNDIVEIVTIPESDRVRLDTFENGQNGNLIRSVGIFVVGSNKYERAAGAESALVVQANLSTEIRPPPETAVAAEALARSISETHVASLGAGGSLVAFTEIVRRAAIVNTGGTYLKWSGVSAGRPARFSLLMIVELDPTASSKANAFVVPGGPPPLEEGPVFVITTGEHTVVPLVEAGAWPILVTRNDAARPVSDLERALRRRFSMLAYEVLDASGAIFGGISANGTLSIGPTKEDDASPAAQDSLQYRVTLPLANRNDLYAVIGANITVAAYWRDIYGNDWPDGIGVRSTQPITVKYVDRLIPLDDLPGLVFAWWPGPTEGSVQVLIAHDGKRLEKLVPSPPIGQTTLTAGQQAALLNALDRTAQLYTRARSQLADKRVSARVEYSLWAGNTQPLSDPDRQTLIDRLAAVGSLYGALKTTLSDPSLAQAPAVSWQQKVDALATAEIFVLLNFNSANKNNKNESFIELSLRMVVERPTDLVATSGLQLEDLKEIYQATVGVPPSLRDDSADRPDPVWAKPLGPNTRTLPQLAAALFRAAPNYYCTTGFSSVPGLTDKAIWLVRKDALPDDNIYANASRLDLAITPVSTTLHSGDIQVPTFDATGAAAAPKTFSFRDADASAQEALSRIDAVLDPRVLKTVASQGSTDDLEGILDAKGALADYFSARAMPVFANALAADPNNKIGTSARALLSNRFRRRLELIYDLDALVAYSSGQDGSADLVGHQAYGTIGGVAIDANTARVSYEPFNLPLAAGTHGLFVACYGTPQDLGADSSGAPIPAPPTFELSHVQRSDGVQRAGGGLQDTKPGDPRRYRPTAWLKLIQKRSLGLGDARRVPVVVRRVPRKPALTKEDFTPRDATGNDVATRLANARIWRTDRDWTWEGKDVDTLRMTLRFNEPDDSASSSTAAAALDDPSAARALAFVKFVGATEGILDVMRDGASAAAALKFFRERAKTLCDDLKTSLPLTAASAPDILQFEITEKMSADGNGRQITASPVDSNSVVLAMPPGLTFGVATLKTDGTVNLAWPGRTTKLQEGFIEESSIHDRRRRLSIDGLDIMARRSVRTELDLTRNANIDGREVARPFVYVVPTIANGSMTRPLLDHPEDIAASDGPDSIGAHFGRIFAGLVQTNGDSAGDQHVADIFVTFEPKLTLKPQMTKQEVARGEGVLVTAWRGGKLLKDGDAIKNALARKTSDWLIAHQPPRGTDTEGVIVLDIRVYDGLFGFGGTGQCVLRLRRGKIPLSHVT